MPKSTLSAENRRDRDYGWKYTPLYEKGTRENKNKPMETTKGSCSTGILNLKDTASFLIH